MHVRFDIPVVRPAPFGEELDVNEPLAGLARGLPI
jgi:hypothetical protein